jgi:AraC-like DNA-binding protein
MDAREQKRVEVLSSVLGDAIAALKIVSVDLARSISDRQYEQALRLLMIAGDEQGMPSHYWRSVKQAADVLGLKDVADFARAKRRETGLTDL